MAAGSVPAASPLYTDSSAGGTDGRTLTLTADQLKDLLSGVASSNSSGSELLALVEELRLGGVWQGNILRVLWSLFRQPRVRFLLILCCLLMGLNSPLLGSSLKTRGLFLLFGGAVPRPISAPC